MDKAKMLTILREETLEALGSPYAERMHDTPWETAALAAMDRGRVEVIRQCADLVAADLSDCSGSFIAEQLRDLSFQHVT